MNVPQVQRGQTSRLPGLDVIRGLAALSVVIHHLMVLYVPLPAGPANAIIMTWTGAVPLFFALSAFSLLLGYGSKCWDEHSLRRFYVRRVFRIFPLFYFMLALYVMLFTLRGLYVSKAEVVMNLLFLFPFFPGKHESLVWAGWSLGVEVGFYALFPIAALLSRWSTASVAVLLGLTVVSSAASTLAADLSLARTFTKMSLPATLVYFQAGIVTFALLDRAAKEGRQQVVVDWLAKWGMALVAVSMAVLLFHKFSPYATLRSLVPVELLLALACSLWIAAAYAGLPKWLDTRATRFLGKLSYGIYLVHPLVLWTIHQLGIYEALRGQVQDPYFAFLACVAVTVPVVILMAEVVYRLVESPGIALGERLVTHFRREPKPVGA